MKFWMRVIDRMLDAAEVEAVLEEGRKRVLQHEVTEASWNAKMCAYAAAEREMGASVRCLMSK